MSSSSRVRRRLAGTALFLAAGVAFTATGLAVSAWLGHGHEPQSSPPAAFRVQSRDASPSPSSSPRRPAIPPLTSPVPVVPGAEQVDGVSLGYPHTLTGAVSAAVAFTTAIFSTLDPGQAAQMMRVVADPSFPQGPAQVAEGVTGIRESLGLPAGGPVPQGVSWAVSPVECQVRDAGTDRVTVLLLMDLISTVPGAGYITRASVFPVAVHWAAGDWKVLPTPATSYARLIAVPGTGQASSLGWLPLSWGQP
jgi:hypothetical protein